jgi:hypothetical protein
MQLTFVAEIFKEIADNNTFEYLKCVLRRENMFSESK